MDLHERRRDPLRSYDMISMVTRGKSETLIEHVFAIENLAIAICISTNALARIAYGIEFH
jgi:hypothetical protein